MSQQIQLGDITIAVVFKTIKNIHLSVHPPEGRVSISAPKRMRLENIRLFAVSKLAWIKQQQKKMQTQARETPREYLERESHYRWGQRYLLTIRERDRASFVKLDHNRMVLYLRRGTNQNQRHTLVESWYREILKEAVPPLIAKWEPLMNVKINSFFVQRMKTKWGSCTPAAGNIRLNTELAQKPPECLEYIVVHEMTILLEPTHNAHFRALMDQFMPKWQFYLEQLNRLPIRHKSWEY